MKSFLTGNLRTRLKITLIKKNWKGFFANIVPNFKVIPSENFESTTQCEAENPLQNAINKFKKHPSIQMIVFKSEKSLIFAQLCTMNSKAK